MLELDPLAQGQKTERTSASTDAQSKLQADSIPAANSCSPNRPAEKSPAIQQDESGQLSKLLTHSDSHHAQHRTQAAQLMSEEVLASILNQMRTLRTKPGPSPDNTGNRPPSGPLHQPHETKPEGSPSSGDSTEPAIRTGKTPTAQESVERQGTPTAQPAAQQLPESLSQNRSERLLSGVCALLGKTVDDDNIVFLLEQCKAFSPASAKRIQEIRTKTHIEFGYQPSYEGFAPYGAQYGYREKRDRSFLPQIAEGCEKLIGEPVDKQAISQERERLSQIYRQTVPADVAEKIEAIVRAHPLSLNAQHEALLFRKLNPDGGITKFLAPQDPSASLPIALCDLYSSEFLAQQKALEKQIDPKHLRAFLAYQGESTKLDWEEMRPELGKAFYALSLLRFGPRTEIEHAVRLMQEACTNAVIEKNFRTPFNQLLPKKR